MLGSAMQRRTDEFLAEQRLVHSGHQMASRGRLVDDFCAGIHMTVAALARHTRFAREVSRRETAVRKQGGKAMGMARVLKQDWMISPATFERRRGLRPTIAGLKRSRRSPTRPCFRARPSACSDPAGMRISS